MKTKTFHPKIKELQLRATPVMLSGTYVDKDGQLRSIDFKIEAGEEDRIMKGYLAVWGVTDTYGTAFVKGCAAKSIRERGPESGSKQKIAFLWMHEVCEPIGRFTVLKEDDYGLYFEAELDEVPTAERALRQVRSGTLNQFSIGFNYIWDKVEYDEKNDILLLYEIELMEGSVVTFGSNAETYAMRSTEQLETDRAQLLEETEDFIKSIPRSQQLALRQLITRHISLAKVKPEERKQIPLEKREPDEVKPFVVGSYNLNLNEF